MIIEREQTNEQELSESANREQADTAFDPVQALNELKANTVPKTKYEQIKGERDKYLKALFEGKSIEEKANATSIDVNECRRKILSGELNALDYAKTALDMRNEIIERNGEDIFVARGAKITPTNEDYEAAQRVADGFQHCIDIADGDSEIFVRELMRITNDAAPMTSRINPKIRR